MGLFFTGTLPHSTTDLFIRPIIIPLSRAPPSNNFDNFSTMWTTANRKSITETYDGNNISDFILYLTPIYYSAFLYAFLSAVCNTSLCRFSPF